MAEAEKQTKIGSFLRRRREELDLSISELAGKMPITAGTVGDIERGIIKTPSTPVLRAFARELKVSLSRLRGLLPPGAKPADQVARNEYEAEVFVKACADIVLEMKQLAERISVLEEDQPHGPGHTHEPGSLAWPDTTYFRQGD